MKGFVLQCNARKQYRKWGRVASIQGRGKEVFSPALRAALALASRIESRTPRCS